MQVNIEETLSATLKTTVKLINKINHRTIPIQIRRVLAIREIIDRTIRGESALEPPPKYEQLELQLRLPAPNRDKEEKLEVIARLRHLIRRSNEFVTIEDKNTRDFANLWALCQDNPRKWGLSANWRSYLAGHSKTLDFDLDYGRAKEITLNKRLLMAILDASENLLTKRNIRI